MTGWSRRTRRNDTPVHAGGRDRGARDPGRDRHPGARGGGQRRPAVLLLPRLQRPRSGRERPRRRVRHPVRCGRARQRREVAGGPRVRGGRRRARRRARARRWQGRVVRDQPDRRRRGPDRWLPHDPERGNRPKIRR